MSAFDVGPWHGDVLVHETLGQIQRPRNAPRKFVMTRPIRRRRYVPLLAAAILLLASSAAVLAAERDDCAADVENPEQKIASCSRVIADDTENAAHRADAYRRRGAAYYGKSDLDRAIADFSEAMKIDP